MDNLVKLRRWTWELPQSLLGAVLVLFYKKTELKVIEYNDQIVYIYDKFPGGISLGYYTLVDYNRKDLNNNIVRQSLKNSIKHESGHGVQSKYSGPLYLPFFGIPSGCHNIIHRIKRYYHKASDYYSFFTESWADKLGGVVR